MCIYKTLYDIYFIWRDVCHVGLCLKTEKIREKEVGIQHGNITMSGIKPETLCLSGMNLNDLKITGPKF